MLAKPRIVSFSPVEREQRLRPGRRVGAGPDSRKRVRREAEEVKFQLSDSYDLLYSPAATTNDHAGGV